MGGRRHPNMILDRTRDATLLVHLGCAPKRATPPSSRRRATKGRVLFAAIKKRLKDKPGLVHRGRQEHQRRHRGDDHRRPPALHHGAGRQAPVPAINVNDSVTKSKFDNLYGCRESLVDGIRRGTDVMMAGKVAMVAGFGDVARLGRLIAPGRMPCAGLRGRSDLRAAGRHGGLRVTTMRTRRRRADIFVTCHRNIDVITIEHMRAMKDRATCATSSLRL